MYKYLLFFFLLGCKTNDPFRSAVKDVWEKLPNSKPEYFKNHKF